MMVANNLTGCRYSGPGLVSGEHCVTWRTSIRLGAFLIGFLMLTACIAGSKYFQDGVNDATQAMVAKRHGKPHKIDPAANGGETWTYFERGSGTAGFSGQVRGGGCQAYVLTFDKQAILRTWQQQPCHG
ncbi:MAG: hypothetical protein ACXWWE_07405 [Nitrospira sp.]